MAKTYKIHFINGEVQGLKLTDREKENFINWLDGLFGRNVYEVSQCINEHTQSYQKYYFVRNAITFIEES